jgi:hypothetical protein
LVIGVALAVVVAVLGVCWWVFQKHLTATERQLVGTWQHHNDPAPDTPQGGTTVWHLAPDHSCRIQWLDAASGQMLDTMTGRWNAEDGMLVFDWDRKVNGTGRDFYLLASVSDDEIVMRPRGGPVRYDLRRTGERQSEG